MELKDKIKRLTNAYGVSGDERREISPIAAELMKPYVDKVEIDEFGNVIGYKKCGVKNAPKLLLAAHIDQIGFVITEITDEGFLRFAPIGGVDSRMLLGSELTVLTQKGPITGVVSSVPPHLQKPGDSSKSVKIQDMTLDIGMTGAQARRAVRVGDYAAFAHDTIDLLGDRVCGKAMDDRACFVCVLHALELLKDAPLAMDIIAVGTTKEEVGAHGAGSVTYRYRPEYAIAIDVGHARTPDVSPDRVPCELGKGPMIAIGSNSRPNFARRVMEIARAKEIPYQLEVCPSSTGTDAMKMQIVESGCCTLVISLPLKYMHSPVEVLSMSDVKNVGRLLAELAKSFDGRL
ncbi:MAG: M20/M25/M40 family metallo-hydrolase [Clostridia bacterium]|nr:M20/M25/M40 family metallo-hydrolase [Clostridia bacterium]